MTLVHNERTKLLATALNNIAVATLATAIIAPVAGLLYGSSSMASSWWPVVGLVWMVMRASLHVAAHYVLGRLQE